MVGLGVGVVVLVVVMDREKARESGRTADRNNHEIESTFEEY